MIFFMPLAELIGDEIELLVQCLYEAMSIPGGLQYLLSLIIIPKLTD